MLDLYKEILRELRASAVLRGAGNPEVYEQIKWLEDRIDEMEG